jgi:serine/threonine protein kinase
METDEPTRLNADQLADLLAVGAEQTETYPPGEPNQGQLPPGTRIDDYEILEEVGRGGMGVVYKAHEHSLNRIVALKTLSPSILHSASAGKRFRREAVLAANLSHPHIAQVFNLDKRPQPRYFTMEFIQGRSLADKVKSSGYLRPAEAIRIALQVCDALACAHRRNILHRDIKPGNILLENHLERVKVTDFGIAQDVSGLLAEVTQTRGVTAGTLGFMSPEQNLGEPLDVCTDIYSLGMTLYYALTGQVAYRAQNPAELAVAFRDQRPHPPSHFNPDVSADLDAVVMKMIAVDRSKRYADCAQVADALRSAEGSRPLSRIRTRWPRRKGFIAAVVLLALGLGSALVSPLARRRNPDQPLPPPPREALLNEAFGDSVLNEELWTWGQTASFSYMGLGKHQFKVEPQNGSLRLEARAEHDRGWQSIQLVWLDSKLDLSECDQDLRVDIRFSGKRMGGRLYVMLSEGKEPKTTDDAESVLLFQSPDPNWREQPLEEQGLSIAIPSRSKMALVSSSGALSERSQTVDLSGLRARKLRFLIAAATATGYPPSWVQMSLKHVKITQEPLEPCLTGTVIDAMTQRPVRGAAIQLDRQKTGVVTDAYGHFVLPCRLGGTAVHAEAKHYEQVDPDFRTNTESGVLNHITLLMRKTHHVAGDVGWAIPFADEVTTIFGLAVEDRWIYFTAREGGESLVLYRQEHNGLARTRLGLLTMEWGLTLANDQLFGLAWWPGRLYKVERDARSREVARLPLAWPRGLAFDGESLWLLETKGTLPEKNYGAYAIDPETGKIKERFTSEDTKITGIAAEPKISGGRLWISSASGVVYELDAAKAVKSGRMEDAILRKFNGHYDQLAWHAGQLWGVDNGARRICTLLLADRLPDTVNISKNAMWNNQVYISWQNIKAWKKPDATNAVIDTWKVDDNDDGDPRNDRNRVLLNNRTHGAFGILFTIGAMSATDSGFTSTTRRNADGSATVAFARNHRVAQVTAEYTVSPGSPDILGKLSITPHEPVGLREWGLDLINNIWVDLNIGEMQLYDHVVVDGHRVDASEKPSKGEGVEGRDYYEIKERSAGYVALGSRVRDWRTGLLLLKASLPVILKGKVGMRSPYGGWAFNRQAAIGTGAEALQPGKTYLFEALFRAGGSTAFD